MWEQTDKWRAEGLLRKSGLNIVQHEDTTVKSEWLARNRTIDRTGVQEVIWLTSDGRHILFVELVT